MPFQKAQQQRGDAAAALLANGPTCGTEAHYLLPWSTAVRASMFDGACAHRLGFAEGQCRPPAAAARLAAALAAAPLACNAFGRSIWDLRPLHKLQGPAEERLEQQPAELQAGGAAQLRAFCSKRSLVPQRHHQATAAAALAAAPRSALPAPCTAAGSSHTGCRPAWARWRRPRRPQARRPARRCCS